MTLLQITHQASTPQSKAFFIGVIILLAALSLVVYYLSKQNKQLREENQEIVKNHMIQENRMKTQKKAEERAVEMLRKRIRVQEEKELKYLDLIRRSVRRRTYPSHFVNRKPISCSSGLRR